VLRSFLMGTLILRALVVLLSCAISGLMLVRSYRNGPVTTALVFYFFANTFAMAWYVLANLETWFWQSAYMQTFGLIVWIPLAVAVVMLLSALWQGQWPHHAP